MMSSMQEVLVALLDELEQACTETDETDLAARYLRRRVLKAAVAAQVRMDKIKLGVVAA